MYATAHFFPRKLHVYINLSLQQIYISDEKSLFNTVTGKIDLNSWSSLGLATFNLQTIVDGR